MPDFQDYVRNHLGPIGLDGNREAKVVEEIAEHMRACYEEARGRGKSESEALAFAESPFVPWERLRRNIEEVERGGVCRNPPSIESATGIRPILGSLRQDVCFAFRALRRVFHVLPTSQPGDQAGARPIPGAFGLHRALCRVWYVRGHLPHRGARRASHPRRAHPAARRGLTTAKRAANFSSRGRTQRARFTAR